MGPLCPCPNSKKPMKKVPGAFHGAPYRPQALGQRPSFQMVSPPWLRGCIYASIYQGRTDDSWGPRAIGDHGAPVPSPTLKPHPKKPMKGTRGISWGPLLTLVPWAPY
ncbi:unnamed protein product [Staurois parvus]|uniref:Uncharacterized protein n=1 Tax=Staurois parvus TaxID=386267 RepID=A0ABN9FN75_9NEOB|nr:unnamed protein product [Staurois parvus]